MDWIYHNGWEEELAELRREFHRYPEPFWREFRTTARIVEELEALGLTVLYGEDIHVREQMMGLPADEAMDAAYARACGEHPRVVLRAALRPRKHPCLKADSHRDDAQMKVSKASFRKMSTPYPRDADS